MPDIRVTFKRPSMEAETEVGSFAELVGLMQSEETTLLKLFGADMEAVITAINGVAIKATAQGAVITADTDAVKNNEPKKPRKPRAGADPATAVAPDPLPIPESAAPALLPHLVTTLPPNALIPIDDGIPAILRRAPSAEAPPPLPVAAPPLAPPAPPAPPPVGVLGPKVVKALDIHAAGKPDGGAALVQWLIDSGVPIIKGVTYDEACRAVLMISDEKLKGVADRLGAA